MPAPGPVRKLECCADAFARLSTCVNSNRGKGMTIRTGLVLLAAAGLVSGCLGGGSSSSGDRSSRPEPLTGSFLDSAVEGLSYMTATRSGVTDQDGTFTYMEDEAVTFALGETALGGAYGGDVLTPLEINNSMALEDPRVVNLLRLLQSLDVDQDPSNGIQLPPEVAHFSAELDLSDLNSVDQALAQLAPGRSLVSAEAAIAHFEQTLAQLPAEEAGAERVYRSVTVGFQNAGTMDLSACTQWSGAEVTSVVMEDGRLSYTGELRMAGGGVEPFTVEGLGSGRGASGNTEGTGTPLIVFGAGTGLREYATRIWVQPRENCFTVINLKADGAPTLPPAAVRQGPIGMQLCDGPGGVHDDDLRVSWDMYAYSPNGY